MDLDFLAVEQVGDSGDLLWKHQHAVVHAVDEIAHAAHQRGEAFGARSQDVLQ